MIPPIKEPDLAPAGLALLVIFGLLIWYDRPMESSRPFYPDVQRQSLWTTEYAYGGWMWEDPFGFDPIVVNREKEPEPQLCKDQLKATTEKHALNAEKRVKILAPLLKVRSNPLDIENRELRTRYRYAVIAALIESGYRPIEPDRLHFCSIQNNSGDKKYDVRWEYYKSEGKRDIIVAWMSSEIFTNKKPSTSEIFGSEILPEQKTPNFHIFDLNNILDQSMVDDIQKKGNGNIDVIKPPATGNGELVKKLTKELELRKIKESSEVTTVRRFEFKRIVTY